MFENIIWRRNVPSVDHSNTDIRVHVIYEGSYLNSRNTNLTANNIAIVAKF